MPKHAFCLMSVVVVLFMIGEFAVRATGLIDTPLYDADNRIGYIPKPSQSGAFLNENDWAFNELSMGTQGRFQTSGKTDVLLVGDSIVMGGNRYRQDERLAPQIERATGAVVWPIGAASWRLQNELRYLADHRDVVASVDRIVFVLNSADFEGVSSWRTEMAHLRAPPASALVYFLRKQLFAPDVAIRPDMKVPEGDAFAELKRQAPAFGPVFDVWLFPSRAESLDRTLREANFRPAIDRLNGLGIPAMRIFDAASVLELGAGDYHDRSHPTPQATQRLAQAIGDALRSQGCAFEAACRSASGSTLAGAEPVR